MFQIEENNWQSKSYNNKRKARFDLSNSDIEVQFSKS